MDSDDGFSRRRVDVDGVTLSVVDEGRGPAVLLLHGWPDAAALWRQQIPVLVDAGLRAIAPDLRGFGASDRPDGVDAYRVGHSVRDMAALLEHLGIDRAHVVGHDWGAPVAWLLAILAADRVDRLAVLSVGHPAAFAATAEVAGDGGDVALEHLRRQWYALLFQFEGVAEEWLSQDGWRRFRTLVAPARDVDRYIADLSRPGALTASLNWYRANSPLRGMVAGGGAARRLPPVSGDIPVLGLWSAGDRFLVEEQMTRSEAHVAGPWRYERVVDAGHWMQLDQPATVAGLLTEHLTG